MCEQRFDDDSVIGQRFDLGVIVVRKIHARNGCQRHGQGRATHLCLEVLAWVAW